MAEKIQSPYRTAVPLHPMNWPSTAQASDAKLIGISIFKSRIHAKANASKLEVSVQKGTR
jgi:hypothetical protein